jgi:hypothetical protein
VVADRRASFGDVGVGAVGRPPVEQPVGADPVAAVVDQAEVLGGDPGSGELFIGGCRRRRAGASGCSRALGVMAIASAQQPGGCQGRGCLGGGDGGRRLRHWRGAADCKRDCPCPGRPSDAPLLARHPR